MEILNAIDENGNVIAKKEKEDIYRDGDRHLAVHVWIINSNREILVQKRNPNKETYPNLWAISVAGHVRSYENSRQAAIREIREELDIKVTEEELEFLFTLERYRETDGLAISTVDDIYLIELDLDVEKIKMQMTELTDIKYVYYEYLETMYKDNDPLYVPGDQEHEKLFDYLHKKFND